MCPFIDARTLSYTVDLGLVKDAEAGDSSDDKDGLLHQAAQLPSALQETLSGRDANLEEQH